MVFAGRMGWPVLGRTIEFLEDPDFCENEYAEHGPISKAHLFGENSIIVAGIENIRQVSVYELVKETSKDMVF